ncbi:MAG TPA: T9SS type A sorting domain-containing protein, partial [Ignavibacteria bacterium]|nr:T9SS type A sorting domain-containing protein [Ignavibacteria bacterium]
NDDGSNWIYRNEGMGPYWFTSLSIINNYLIAGTDGNGVWRRPLSEVVSIKTISTNIPLKYELYQNYPNPFNPITKVKFKVPLRSFIQIIIYDILGREKEKLVNQELSASEYETTFDGSDYSSGVYFYQLISNGKKIDTKKFMISK